MRLLALDYGEARCGCALSDPTGTIVTPLDRVIVGLPLSLQGTDTEQTRETRAFARQLSQRLGPDVPVEMHDERFTTRMAQRMEGEHSASEDSRAAAHLLESWLAGQSR